MTIRIIILLTCFLLGTAIPKDGDNRSRKSGPLKRNDQAQTVSRDRVSTLFESYDQHMSDEQVRERLDALALYLKGAPSFRAYIVSYAGRKACHGEALMRARLVRDYLSKSKSINSQRIRMIDGGFQEEWSVQLWTGADGTLRPTPMPTLKRREVKIIGNCNRRVLSVKDDR